MDVKNAVFKIVCAGLTSATHGAPSCITCQA